MKVEWLLEGIEDRHAIFSFIEEDDFRAAVRLDEEIEAQTEQLAKFPMMGRAGREAGTRELPINGTPYISVYRISNDRVQILGVIHGSRDRP